MRINPENRLPQQYDQGVLARLLKDFATQLNLLSEGFLTASHNAQSSMPTSGSYAKGDFVKNSNPVEQGTLGFKYYIDGWKRLTSGTSHVLNTDWVTARILTGN